MSYGRKFISNEASGHHGSVSIRMPVVIVFVYFARPETEELLEWEALAPLGLSSGGFQNLTRLGKTTKAISIAFCPCLT
jgi:hypothetical protein